jgi:hypothetical protein
MKNAKTVRLIIDRINPAIIPPSIRLSRLTFTRAIGAKKKKNSKDVNS